MCQFVSFLQKKEDATELQQQSSALKADTDKAEAAAKAAEKERDALLVTIGNLVHDSVPVSDDEVGCSCCPVHRNVESTGTSGSEVCISLSAPGSIYQLGCQLSDIHRIIPVDVHTMASSGRICLCNDVVYLNYD